GPASLPCVYGSCVSRTSARRDTLPVRETTIGNAAESNNLFLTCGFVILSAPGALPRPRVRHRRRGLLRPGVVARGLHPGRDDRQDLRTVIGDLLRPEPGDRAERAVVGGQLLGDRREGGVGQHDELPHPSVGGLLRPPLLQRAQQRGAALARTAPAAAEHGGGCADQRVAAR